MDSDREEILSCSNLQFFSDDDDLQMDSKAFSTDHLENQNSIISSSSASFFDQDFSGFFSEEWTAAISSNDIPEAIIFCGKVIHTTSRNTQNLINNPKNKTDLKNNNKSSSLSRCNSESFCKCNSNHGHSSFSSSGRKKNDSYKKDVLAQRKSKLACSSKSRWQVFMFGSGRFPTKMELSDIRSRQLRQITSKKSEEKGGGKRVMGLIRILGCGGGFNSDDTIKTSFGYLHSFDR